MFRVNTFYAPDSTLESVADWLNETNFKLITIQFEANGLIKVLYDDGESPAELTTK